MIGELYNVHIKSIYLAIHSCTLYTNEWGKKCIPKHVICVLFTVHLDSVPEHVLCVLYTVHGDYEPEHVIYVLYTVHVDYVHIHVLCVL